MYDIRVVRKLTHGELLQLRVAETEAKTIQRHPIRLIVDNVRSLYNVGSIFRSCDAFNVDEVLLCGFTPAPPRKEISKTALGAEATVPFSTYPSALEAIAKQKSDGYTVVAIELTTSAEQIGEIPNHCYPLCFVVGNELTGISNDVLSACHRAMAIPMFGVKHSLNVAVATGIALYEGVRQLPV